MQRGCNSAPRMPTLREDPEEANNVEDVEPEYDPIHRSCWLWIIAILDIVWVASVYTWTNSYYEDQMRKFEAGAGFDDSTLLKSKLTFTSLVAGSSLLLQFVMGLVVIIALTIANDYLLVQCLWAYLIGSWILVSKVVFVLLISIIKILLTDAYANENWQRIVTNMICLVIRVPTHLTVYELVRRYSEIVRSSQIAQANRGNVKRYRVGLQ